MLIHIHVYRPVELRLLQKSREPHLGPYRELRLPLWRLALVCVYICVGTPQSYAHDPGAQTRRRAGGGIHRIFELCIMHRVLACVHARASVPTGRAARLSLPLARSLALALCGIGDLSSDKPQDLDQALVLQAVQDLNA